MDLMITKRRSPFVSLALLLTIGCASPSRTSSGAIEVVNAHPGTRIVPNGPHAAQHIDSLIHVLHSTASGFGAPGRWIIRDDASWEELWRRLMSNEVTPKSLRPTVNFQQQMLVVAALGERPTTGSSITIVAVRSNGQTLTVETLIVTPASPCVGATEITSPVDVVSVPLGLMPIVFVERHQQKVC